MNNPEIYPVRYDKNVRCARIKKFPYYIFYLIDVDLIVILSIFHTSRDVKK